MLNDAPQSDFQGLAGYVCKLLMAYKEQSRPRYIVDLSGHGGALLQGVWEALSGHGSQTATAGDTGVRLIALSAGGGRDVSCRRSLDGIDELLLSASSDADLLTKGLRGLGVTDPENAIFVCALGDDDPGRKPTPLPEHANFQARLEQLAALLSNCQSILRNHGLLVASTASADTDVRQMHARRLLGEMGGLGLFPDPAFVEDGSQQYSNAGIRLFKAQPCRLRHARQSVLADLLRLEEACWAPGLRMPGEILLRRLANFPEGQCVLESDGGLVGVVYSQRVDSPAFEGYAAFNVHELHRDSGPIIQLLSLNILPEAQDRAYGDLLLEFMLQYCGELQGIETVVGITRCKDYAKHCEIGFNDYLALRNDRGRLVDTVLRFHELHGAEVVRAVRDYRPLDLENDGCGVLVSYNLRTRRRRELAVSGERQSSRSVSDIRDYVLSSIATILGENDKNKIPPALPLFELGLDSADLLDFNERITAKFGVRLDPSFFFEHNSCERVIAYLCDRALMAADTREMATPEIVSRSTDTPAYAAATMPAKQAGNDASPSPRDNDVAIVGIACRLPGGVNSAEDFWQLLVDKRDGIDRLPRDRWRWPSNIDPDGEHRGIDFGGFLEDVESFDPAFFRISPREAALMDPQQRLLLQLSWACLEDAGCTTDRISGTDTGVFVGASGSDYQLRLCEQPLEEIEDYFGLGTSMAILANRLSYFYNLNGPSIQIDTACSSSLVAVHEAVKSLNSGGCVQALVGGVNILCHPANSIAFHQSGMLSKSGKCRTFDASADGYVRSEGAVVILLKPLARAIGEHDRIYAVIKGSATNHGGQSAGLTVPNPARQADLIQQACSAADVSMDSIGYIEAHGTGTPLGDPIEIRGLKQAFARNSPRNANDDAASCTLGSVKTNIGHLEAAAGIAGLAKAALCLQNKRIPSSLNFSELNPHISLAGSPIRLADETLPWELPQGQSIRRAGVSSFGSGGANAHAILEEYVPGERAVRRLIVDTERPAIVVLSAKTEDRLKARARQILSVIERRPLEDIYLADLAYTLQVGREAMEERIGVIVSSMGELEDKLRRYLAGEDGIESFYRGNVKQDPSALAAITGDDELHEAIAKWLERGEHAKLLELWILGKFIDWNSLYGAQRPRRISLPTYPFLKERCWIRSPSRASPASVPSPQIEAVKAEDVAGVAARLPQEALAARIRQNIARILGTAEDKLSPDENLRTYGLDSIGAMRLQQWIEKDLGISVSGRELLELGTIETLVKHISGRLADKAEKAASATQSQPEPAPVTQSITPDLVDDEGQLSEGQKGLWALQQFSPTMSAYNVPLCLRVYQRMDAHRFEAACRTVLQRNPVLGNAIIVEDGEPHRSPRLSECPFLFEDDISGLSEEETFAYLEQKLKEPFALKSGPLARFNLLRRSAEETIVLVVIHHIGFDAGSIVPFLMQLLDAYRQPADGTAQAGSLAVAYSDFVSGSKPSSVEKRRTATAPSGGVRSRTRPQRSSCRPTSRGVRS